MEKSKKELIVKSVTELVNKFYWDKTQEERTQQIGMLCIDEFEKLNKSDVISSVCNHETIKVRNKTVEICKKCGKLWICV